MERNATIVAIRANTSWRSLATSAILCFALALGRNELRKGNNDANVRRFVEHVDRMWIKGINGNRGHSGVTDKPDWMRISEGH